MTPGGEKKLSEEETRRLGSPEKVPRPRIQALSDLIFGLALSIGAISILSEKPASVTDLAVSLLGFGWAFLILAMVWVRYTRIMSALPVETGGVMAVNMLLLFLVSIEPYLYNLVGGSITSSNSVAQLSSETTTALYALDMGSIFLILAFFTNELSRGVRKLIPKDLLESYRLQTISTVVSAVLFLVSCFPFFWDVTIFGFHSRFFMWMGTFLVWIVRRGLESRLFRKNEPRSRVNVPVKQS